MITVNAHGARIPAIGLGTWELRGRDGARVIEQALRLGYRHVDTAQIYDNEKQVGEALRASGVPRDDVFITTKVHTAHFAPNDLERSVKDSLVRMRMTELDLLLLHWPNSRVPLVETLGGLARVKQMGLTRHIGLSNFTVPLLQEAVTLCPEPLVCNQIEYHAYLDQHVVIEACRRYGMVVVAYCPIARGRVKGDEVLSRIGAAHGKSAAQVSLRWLIQQGVAAIPRTSRVERLSENLDVFDFVLADDEMKQIFALASARGRICDFDFSPVWD